MCDNWTDDQDPDLSLVRHRHTHFRKRCSNNNKNNNRLSETSTWSASRKQRTTCAVFSFPLVIIINIKKSKAQSFGGLLTCPSRNINRNNASSNVTLLHWGWSNSHYFLFCGFCSTHPILYCTQVHWKRWKRKKEEPFFQRLGRLSLGPSSPPRRCGTKDPDSRSHATIDVLRNIRQQPSMRVCVCVCLWKKEKSTLGVWLWLEVIVLLLHAVRWWWSVRNPQRQLMDRFVII